MTFCPNFSYHFPSGSNEHTAGAVKRNGHLLLQPLEDCLLEKVPREGFMCMALTPGVVSTMESISVFLTILRFFSKIMY